MTLREAVDMIYQMNIEGRREFHYGEVAVAVTMHINEFKDKSPDDLKNKIRDYLYNSATKISNGRRIVNNEGKYQQVKNGRGGFKQGIYKLKKPRNIPQRLRFIIQEAAQQYSDNSSYIGSAGEMAVSSELLFRGYNISRMAVDDGVDIVATKNDTTYYIQVKTVGITSLNKTSFRVSISNGIFARYNNHKCYYIVVARGDKNHFIVLTAVDIKRMQDNGDIRAGVGSITLNFKQNGDNHLYIKNEKVDYALNSFERIV